MCLGFQSWSNAIIVTDEQEDVVIGLAKIEWLMPFVLSDEKMIRLLKIVEKHKPVGMVFRS